MAAGRPKRFVPTKKRLDEITKRISEGHTESSIARWLGYSPTHFPVVKRRHPELAEAINAGREVVEQSLVGKLYAKAFNDNDPKQVACIFFILKSQYGWRDSGEVTTAKDKPKKTRKVKFTGDPETPQTPDENDS